MTSEKGDLQPFDAAGFKPLFKFAFGEADGWEARLDEDERKSLQDKVHAVFEKTGDTLPWGYESDDDLGTLVDRWLGEVKARANVDLFVDLSPALAKQRSWFIGGEWYSCVHAPAFLRRPHVLERWTIELDTNKRIPMSFRASCLFRDMKEVQVPNWRRELFHIVQRKETEEKAEEAVRDWLDQRAASRA